MSRVRWNDFTEKKPKTSGVYIVHVPTKDPEMPFIATAWWECDPEHLDGQNPKWSWLQKSFADCVTHWMKTPSPPNPLEVDRAIVRIKKQQ